MHLHRAGDFLVKSHHQLQLMRVLVIRLYGDPVFVQELQSIILRGSVGDFPEYCLLVTANREELKGSQKLYSCIDYCDVLIISFFR